MNDYHLDPPEEPEIPECCDREMLVLAGTGNLVCSACGKKIIIDPDIEPPDETPDEWVCESCGEKYPCRCELPMNQTDHCPHGRDHGNCDACDHAGDLAYDEARESRMFR